MNVNCNLLQNKMKKLFIHNQQKKKQFNWSSENLKILSLPRIPSRKRKKFTEWEKIFANLVKKLYLEYIKNS